MQRPTPTALLLNALLQWHRWTPQCYQQQAQRWQQENPGQDYQTHFIRDGLTHYCLGDIADNPVTEDNIELALCRDEGLRQHCRCIFEQLLVVTPHTPQYLLSAEKRIAIYDRFIYFQRHCTPNQHPDIQL